MAYKILTEQEAYNIGQTGTPTANLLCTYARAQALGCTANSGYTLASNQLVYEGSIQKLRVVNTTLYGEQGTSVTVSCSSGGQQIPVLLKVIDTYNDGRNVVRATTTNIQKCYQKGNSGEYGCNNKNPCIMSWGPCYNGEGKTVVRTGTCQADYDLGNGTGYLSTTINLEVTQNCCNSPYGPVDPPTPSDPEAYCSQCSSTTIFYNSNYDEYWYHNVNNCPTKTVLFCFKYYDANGNIVDDNVCGSASPNGGFWNCGPVRGNVAAGYSAGGYIEKGCRFK